MGMIKTPSEIRLLKKSAKITDSCIKVIEKSLQDEITEIELRKIIGKKIRSQGASLGFRTLIASGKRSGFLTKKMVHCRPSATDRIISGIGYIDFGAKYKGYVTDVTVPFVKGKIDKKQRRIVNTTIKAYEISLKSIKLGQPCWKIFQKYFNYLKTKGYKPMYALGHGIGKKAHEYPIFVMPSRKRLSPKGKKMWEKIKNFNFQENMVFAIEPGIHVKGVGGTRIENDILMTKRGPKVLTHSRLIKI